MPVSESFPVRGSMLLAGFSIAAVLLVVMIPDKGEVVRLITDDEAGEHRETELWIAEVDGQTYFRASSPDSRWLARLRSEAPASLERGGHSVEIETTVEDDPQIRARLDRAMSEKYGLADRLWGLMRSPDCVAIRVEPRVRPLDSGVVIGSAGSQATPA
ncbi:MAG: DUF2255 family protein, partial [Deltaproteobacteria bacterium]|nr:DUF2255 family protein [Deltaproteobacteria bacterium]